MMLSSEEHNMASETFSGGLHTSAAGNANMHVSVGTFKVTTAILTETYTP